METVIIICLLIVIALLLQDKIVIRWKSKQNPTQQKVNLNLPDIMGQPKPVRSQSVPNSATKRQIAEPEVNPDNLDIEYDKNEIVDIQIPKEKLDEVFNNEPDLAEEEEDLNRLKASDSDDGFAQGVTFEELNNVGILLQKETLEPPQKETAFNIVQRLQGTELLALLESSMDDASRKIAKLLDGSLNAGSFTLENDDFDIEEFV